MKILLLGEFSGLNKALKEGLQHNGIDVTLAANGDGWKEIGGADMPLYPIKANSNFFEKIKNYIVFPLIDKRFRGYDIVQAVTPYLYFWLTGVIPFENIRENNGKFFVNIAGDDHYSYRYWKNGGFKYDRYLYEGNERLKNAYNEDNIKSKISLKTFERIINDADGVIPCIPYEYEEPYKKLSNIRKTILFPINIDLISYKPNCIKRKIVIFHGINRYEDKGSKYIIEAMKIIQERFKNEVECIVTERLPYREYEEVLNRANVVIDQCRIYGYGINACISMAKGKVVLSGSEKEVIERINGKCPIVNIRPNVQQIVTELEKIIRGKDNIEQMGYESRMYVEKHHNYIDVAQKYYEEWRK